MTTLYLAHCSHMYIRHIFHENEKSKKAKLLLVWFIYNLEIYLAYSLLMVPVISSLKKPSIK